MLLEKTVPGPEGSAQARRADLRSNPISLLAILLATILVVEILVMVLLSQFDMAHVMFVRLGIDLPDNQHMALEAIIDGLLLTLIVFPVLYFAVFKNITDKNKTLADSEARLEERVEDRTRALDQTVNRLNRRQNESFALNETIHQFQSCETTDAVFRIIQDQLSSLFPGLSGNLLLVDDEDVLPTEFFCWGEVKVFQEQELLSLYERTDFQGPHVSEDTPGSSAGPVKSEEGTGSWRICLPLNTRTKSMGLLVLQAPFDPTGNEFGEDVDRRGHFWGSLAESLAMSISNLRLRADLSQQALRDALTGLYNRRYLTDFIDRELQKLQRAPGSFSVLMIDIDHFKTYNDTYGHAGGDAVLMTLGTMLNSWVRRGDIITRNGGEEFVAILTGVDGRTAMQRAEDLRLRIQALNIAHDGRDLGLVTVSIGVAVYPEHGVDRDTLIQAADSAMYASKQAGRNRVSLAEAAAPAIAEDPVVPAQRKIG